MFASNLIYLSSQLLHLLSGGAAMFCLYYAALIPDVAVELLPKAFLFGGMATAIVYFQGKSNV